MMLMETRARRGVVRSRGDALEIPAYEEVDAGGYEENDGVEPGEAGEEEAVCQE